MLTQFPDPPSRDGERVLSQVSATRGRDEPEGASNTGGLGFRGLNLGFRAGRFGVKGAGTACERFLITVAFTLY